MNSFQAFTLREQDTSVIGQLETITLDDLSEGTVVIKAAYSSVNFKDSLASKKDGGVIRNYPMIPGIDVSGTVVTSEDPRFKEGDKVIVTGYQLGVSHTGGYSEYVRVPGDWVVPLPEKMSLKEAMIFGTAGFTAGLSVTALEDDGLRDDKEAPIIVTGATGGVATLSIAMLHQLGYTSITALTRKPDSFELLKELGVSESLLVEDFLATPVKALMKQRFAFAIDTTGGEITSAVLPQLRYDGRSAICGRAAGITLETTVLPFILRGVHLLGIDSVNVGMDKRKIVWQRLATDLDITEKAVYQEITLEELPPVFEALQAGQHIGRTIVRIS
ncbi:TPA: YhdH/YhfP family quinone oxidoreductase [Enterococcus faecalis]|nr:YhdH/YhfP family quinone oxidoreductase [Enterococcus faecalis]HAP3469228.1 YhdH/YhfP family quinone oxidoreductase [Enterococcus faecalis]HAP3487013.1 YhdH/YhfP family quinone oxidoreductase [Enterococcus faecalis]HAP3495883.1 YhdH/YhfP family quinone oxidoreductase [Enterococcus faecalis]HAP3507456.1 YhdH/YhfP family quinone oxidoreductase [Enterococcus faecalis]